MEETSWRISPCELLSFLRVCNSCKTISIRLHLCPRRFLFQSRWYLKHHSTVTIVVHQENRTWNRPLSFRLYQWWCEDYRCRACLHRNCSPDTWSWTLDGDYLLWYSRKSRWFPDYRSGTISSSEYAPYYCICFSKTSVTLTYLTSCS